jgi:HEAT repeat protein
MRLALVTFTALLLAAPQDARKKFDELLRQLDEDALEAREQAAKSMADLPAEADAWIEEAARKAAGERRAQLQSVLDERKLRIEIKRLQKLGLSEPFLRAHPDLLRRVSDDNPLVRVALLEEITGVKLDPEDDDPDSADETPVRSPASPRETAIIIELCFQKPANKRLKHQVLAIVSYRSHPSLLGALRVLLRDSEAVTRERALEYLDYLDCDCSPVVPELLKIIEEGDRDLAGEAEAYLDEIDWTEHLDALLASLPKMGEDRRESVIGTVTYAIAARLEPKIRPLLSSPEPHLRYLAATYYGTHAALERPEELAKLLDDPSESTKSEAFCAYVGRLPKERLLAAAAQEKDQASRRAAIRELVRRRLPEARDLLRKDLEAGIQGTAGQILALGDEAFIAEVSERLETGSVEERQAYVNWLRGQPRDKAVPALRRMLGAGEPEVLSQVAYALAYAAGEAAIDDMLKLITSEDEQIRTIGAQGLGQIRVPRARDEILRLLKESPNLRNALYGAFYNWDGPDAVEKILELGIEPPLNQNLSWVMQRRPFGKDHPKLRDALAASDPYACSGAIVGLLAATDEARDAVAARIKGMSAAELRGMMWMLPRDGSVPGLAERSADVLKDLPEDERQDVDGLLAELGDAAAAKRVARRAIAQEDFNTRVPLALLTAEERAAYRDAALLWIRSQKPRDRDWALDELMRDGIEAAIDELWKIALNAAESADSSAASYVVDAHPQRVRALARPYLESKVESERHLAAYALGSAGDESDRARLRPLLKDPSPTVRAAAAAALGELEDRDAADAIAALLADPEERVRSEAVGALEIMRAGPLDALKAACADRQLRPAALRARASLGDVSCAEEYLKMLEGAPSGASDGLRALAKAGSKPVLDYLKARLGKDPACTRVLAELGDAGAIDALVKDGTIESATTLLEVGKLDDPAAWLDRLVWVSDNALHPFLLALNCTVDRKRYEALIEKWTAPRWVGPKASDLAAALTELLGVPVKADASLRDRREGFQLGRGMAFDVVERAVPVFEGDGITLYSYAAAREVWRKRLAR